jgi:glyoxylase-like metal-dependent hydrolase (beta-lactamase superfamily II)
VGDPDADYANWIRALDRLAEWKARVVVPAHGELGSVDTLRGQRSYLAEMLEKVEEGLRAGRTADEVAGAMDLSKHRPFGTDRARTASQARTMFRTMERNR